VDLDIETPKLTVQEGKGEFGTHRDEDTRSMGRARPSRKFEAGKTVEMGGHGAGVVWVAVMPAATMNR
jgi:hypothetical protein